MPALDAPCVQALLDAFAAYPESLNLLLWDGAPAHIAHALVILPNVVLIQLPAYSPELNPVERLWEDLRYRLGSELRQARRIEGARGRVDSRLLPQQLASLCGYEYLLQILHAPPF